MAQRMRLWFTEQVARNLKFPERGLFGWLSYTFFVKYNSYMELNAVRLSNIKPDHNVLEIGFGPGVGLEAAYNIVKNGKGKVFGVDYSLFMMETARKRAKKGVNENKIMLYHANVSQIPLNTDSVQRVFHTNSYYYWPNLRLAVREIYRVMQPGAIMVTTLNMNSLKTVQNLGFLKYGHPDPVKYMRCLENYGFENVRMEYHKDQLTGRQFQTIFCEVIEKPAHGKSMDIDDDDDEVDAEPQLLHNTKD
uniref:Methyltransferase type 11 domain-containing protein n=1 Tax=Arion vulgaris TaxID=1028688 RepID=A0A0B7BMQ8_9EUPU